MLKRFLMPALALLLILPACAARPVVVPTGSALPATQRPLKPTVFATGTPAPGCTVASLKPTAGPTEQSLFPVSKEGDQVEGPDNASVTIIEYSDFQ
jgi:hypothetical protein